MDGTCLLYRVGLGREQQKNLCNDAEYLCGFVTGCSRQHMGAHGALVASTRRRSRTTCRMLLSLCTGPEMGRHVCTCSCNESAWLYLREGWQVQLRHAQSLVTTALAAASHIQDLCDGKLGMTALSAIQDHRYCCTLATICYHVFALIAASVLARHHSIRCTPARCAPSWSRLSWQPPVVHAPHVLTVSHIFSDAVHTVALAGKNLNSFVN